MSRTSRTGRECETAGAGSERRAQLESCNEAELRASRATVIHIRNSQTSRAVHQRAQLTRLTSLTSCPPSSHSSPNLSHLKAELKAWEAAFRASHGGQDPTKADIKADAEIARKYKEYNKHKTSKSTLKAPPSSVHPSSSTSDASNSTARGRPAAPGSAARPAAVGAPSTPTKPKRASHSSVSPAKSAAGTAGADGGPTYVIANSPSKLRALAAAHSTFGSPNRSSSHAAASNRKGKDDLAVVGSPKKYNPFSVTLGGSPARRDLFGASAGRQKEKKALDKGKTREGAGWGSSEATRGWESMFSTGASAATTSSRRMDEDEELDPTMEEDYAAMIDEALGPSPVKPSAGRRKEFKPLFDTATQPATAFPPPPPPPKPFTTEFVVPRVPSKALPNGSSASRALKRAPTPPAEEREAGSDEEEEEEVVGKGSKAKRKKVAAAGGKVKAKAKATNGKAQAGIAASGGFDERGRTRVGSTLVLDMEAGETGDQVDRVVIRPRRPYFKGGSSKPKDPDAMDDDGEREDSEDNEENLIDSQGASLFYRDSADLLNSQPSQNARATTFNHSDDEDTPSQPRVTAHDVDATVDLDSDLAAILSLRSSPIKKTAQKREKERDTRVKELLMEPGTKREVKGLVDLAEAQGSENEEEQEVEGSDDDWASDAEGWKDLGDGEMDGYDEAW